MAGSCKMHASLCVLDSYADALWVRHALISPKENVGEGEGGGGHECLTNKKNICIGGYCVPNLKWRPHLCAKLSGK